MSDDISWLSQIKYRLFNKRPYPDAQFIETYEGTKFWIDFDEQKPLLIGVGKNARLCGFIRLLWKNETLEICEINLFPKYRGKGLGTQLLNWLITYARQENIKELWGLVAPEDEQDFDRLMAWYLRHGFQRETQSGNSIRLRL